MGEKQDGGQLFTPTEKKQKKDVDDIATLYLANQT